MMNNKLKHLAMAVLMATSLLATTMSAAFSGAIYTSLGDGTTVNANNYSNCEDVYLNGGPQNVNGSGLPDGIYLFEVTNPSTADLLSTDLAMNRQVQVINGRIYGTPGQDSAGPADDVVVAPLFGANPADMHALGSYNADNLSVPVQLWEFADTTNNGGVYKVTLYSVADGAYPDGMNIVSESGNKKSDNFRCVHDGGTGSDTTVIFGRKYYDINANGVFDDGEDWTTADGRPPVTIDLTIAGVPGFTATTDDTGLWFYVLPQNVTFAACEVEPDGYNQTGPLDGDAVSNADAAASASGGCWSGAVTLVGLDGLNFGNVDTVTIGGVKFYDANADGVWQNPDEVTIPGFKIVLEITYPDDSADTVELFTDSGGAWSYVVPIGSDVTACEVAPGPTWIQTAPASLCHEVLDVQDDTTNLDFGNVCLGAGGGLTLGFWSNKNGEAQMKDGGSLNPELAMLVALNLRNANGTNFDPGNYAAFRTWILAATATNMANMLSAQLAAMSLNVEAGFVSGGSLVYTPCSGFITINNLMNDANTSLGTSGLTVVSSPTRTYQECLKTALDLANNNKNFVQTGPCPFTSPY